MTLCGTGEAGCPYGVSKPCGTLAAVCWLKVMVIVGQGLARAKVQSRD